MVKLQLKATQAGKDLAKHAADRIDKILTDTLQLADSPQDLFFIAMCGLIKTHAFAAAMCAGLVSNGGGPTLSAADASKLVNEMLGTLEGKLKARGDL